MSLLWPSLRELATDPHTLAALLRLDAPRRATLQDAMVRLGE